MSNDQNIEVFVDALGGIMLGHPITKLTFVCAQQNADPDQETIQSPRLVLTMTTQALVNACNLILKNVQDNRDVLVSTAESNLLTFKSSLLPDGAVQNEKPSPSSKARSRS